MIHIRFIAADESAQDIQTNPGHSLMKAAVDAGVRGIEADCGGTLTCATCHVMLDAETAARFPAAVQDERDMLDFAAAPVDSGSRLSCQLMLTPEMDGLVVRLPARQY
ncbi:2Fe-2S iron-sulfur cluster-binding protein [Hydrogenophaga sp. PAMC20947]|uniref:2Fe-2S iron-sulfur cluster-binding protein n=1 Tax=Hydrogenophaga sp. PAMC20947 TaxID=2565558 RepID=UPI00109DE4FB|nr:2Fe-2S iron-sulfur cluster-binding protein [Hydrogenophaga sp. PAMC20947]QCB45750.1 2Fe-2S iron-sulfur cluster binding domain-containing protein [Hydrogenophaga sp. PAMC20947]